MAKKRVSRLSDSEKLQIQQLTSEGKTPKEISIILNRTEHTIRKYINYFKELISKIDIEYQQEQDMPPNEFVSLDMYNEALKFMNMNGLSNATARSRLNSTIAKLLSTPSSAEDLAKTAFNQITAQEVMVNKSAGGREGVVVMTEAASYHGDRRRIRNRRQLRSDVLYNAKTGKPI